MNTKNIILGGLLLLAVACAVRTPPSERVVLKEIEHPDYLIWAHEGRLYVTDDKTPELSRTTVYVYSLMDYRLLAEFGGPGDEPGQFEIQPGHGVILAFRERELFVNSAGKLTRMTLDGIPLEVLEIKDDHFFFKPIGRGFVGQETVMDNDRMFYQVNIYDERLNPLRTLARREIANIEFEGNLDWEIDRDRIYLANTSDDFRIEVFNADGLPVRSIHREYKRLRPTQHHREAVIDVYRANPAWAPHIEEIKKSLRYSDYFSAINGIHVGDDKIYVVTNKQVEDRREIVILDLEGDQVWIKMVPFRMSSPISGFPYTIHGERLYQIVQDRTTNEWILDSAELF